MIKRIFWDLDHVLAFSDYEEPDQNHIKFYLIDDIRPYFTIIRPCARKLIDWSRDLVGVENVFILTSSIEEYANIINEKGGLGFRPDQIFHRGDLENYRYSTAYGSSCTVPHELANENNVLIDDLLPRYNENKMSFIGINSSRYLQVREYYGVDFPDDPFEEDVKNFLTKLKNEQ